MSVASSASRGSSAGGAAAAALPPNPVQRRVLAQSIPFHVDALGNKRRFAERHGLGAGPLTFEYSPRAPPVVTARGGGDDGGGGGGARADGSGGGASARGDCLGANSSGSASARGDTFGASSGGSARAASAAIFLPRRTAILAHSTDADVARRVGFDGARGARDGEVVAWDFFIGDAPCRAWRAKGARFGTFYLAGPSLIDLVRVFGDNVTADK